MRSRWLGLEFWIPTGISIAALVVSVASFYYSAIRQVDRISMVTKDRPIAFREGTDQLALSFTDMTLAFVNSGNRPALIYELDVWVIQSEGTSAEDCALLKAKGIAELETNFEATVVKQNEVVVKSVQVTRDSFTKNRTDKKTGQLAIAVSKELRQLAAVPTEVCFVITMATPSKKVHRVSISIAKYRASRGENGMPLNLDMDEKMFTDVKPYTLIEETRTIFD